jgi:hypothetical protein
MARTSPRLVDQVIRHAAVRLNADEGHGDCATLIQRFVSADSLNRNIHLHRLFQDGVHARDGECAPRFIVA